MKVISKVP